MDADLDGVGLIGETDLILISCLFVQAKVKMALLVHPLAQLAMQPVQVVLGKLFAEPFQELEPPLLLQNGLEYHQTVAVMTDHPCRGYGLWWNEKGKGLPDLIFVLRRGDEGSKGRPTYHFPLPS